MTETLQPRRRPRSGLFVRLLGALIAPIAAEVIWRLQTPPLPPRRTDAPGLAEAIMRATGGTDENGR